jgi:hypothetical protein
MGESKLFGYWIPEAPPAPPRPDPIGEGSRVILTAMALSPELSNVEFHCGRAEDLVPALVNRLASQQLVAILDPPRAGLRE